MTTEPGDPSPNGRKKPIAIKKAKKSKKNRRISIADRKLEPFDLGSYLLSPKAEMALPLKQMSLRMHSSKIAQEQSTGQPPICQLDLFQNPLRAGVIPGLDWNEGQVQLHQSKWACCLGTGSHYRQDDNSTMRCSLHQRFLTIQRLVAHFTRWNPTADLMEIFAPTRFNPVLQQLSLIATKQSSHGMVFWRDTRDNQDMSFSRFFWSTAFAAQWRFGLSVMLRDLSSQNPIIFGNQDGPLPTVLMVYNVSELWSPATFEALDYLVSFAYNGCIPLFIELKPPEKMGEDSKLQKAVAPRPKVQSSHEGFSSLIKSARQKTTRAAYPPGFMSKLRTVTKGFPPGILD